MTTSPQTAIPPMTIPFSERLSETWLLERTYHAQLRNGQELPVSNLTCAMKQLTDFDVPLSSQSSKSKLAERVPLKKSTNFSVPVSTWREISQKEAAATSQQGIPVLLYTEHVWGIQKEPKPRGGGVRIKICAPSSRMMPGCNQRRSLEPTTPCAILTHNEGRSPMLFGKPGLLLAPRSKGPIAVPSLFLLPASNFPVPPTTQ